QWDQHTFIDTHNSKVEDSIGRDRNSNDTDKVSDWEISCGKDVNHPTPGSSNNPIILTNEFIGLINGYGDNDGKVCFANYTEYIFQMKVSDPNGVRDLNEVKFQLDPSGENLTFIWEEEKDKFIECYDPNNFVAITSNSTDSINNGVDTWTLNFSIIFNWTYPNENLSSCKVHSISDYGFEDMDNNEEVYKVENDLDFIDNLSVRGEYHGELTNGSWVISNENITWTGLKVVYEGAENIYPRNEDFDVVLWDDDGEFWHDLNSSGSDILIHSVSDPSTDMEDLHILNITGIPKESDISNVKFELKVDGDNIIFLEPYPAHGDWQNSSTFECGITVRDTNGSGVKGNSIEYRILVEGAPDYTGWTNANASEDALELNCSVFPTFAEGKNNYIQWRGKDLAGNSFKLSEKYQIQIDLTEVTYADVYPSSYEWQNDNNVIFNITIKDSGGSGVNGEKIEYRLVTQANDNYGNWINVGETLNSEIVQVSVNLTLEDGEDNYIQFRAKDVAGNGYTLSDEYQIKVNTTPIFPNQPPNVVIDSPKEGWVYYTSDEVYFDGFNSTDIDNDELTFQWISNITGNLDFSSRFYASLPAGFHRITLLIDDGHAHKVSTSVNIELKVPLVEPIEGFVDKDGDGMNDSWEQEYGLDPTNPKDALEDLDDDGLINLQEYLGGTDPTDVNDPQPGGQERTNVKSEDISMYLLALIILVLILIAIICTFMLIKFRTRRMGVGMSMDGETLTTPPEEVSPSEEVPPVAEEVHEDEESKVEELQPQPQDQAPLARPVDQPEGEEESLQESEEEEDHITPEVEWE
ncbi:MAG: hypothetical protein KAJ51_10880, partial [Thermoplasmata archaeon]|nr:hypothetical protein [Thermoplasmata archaeon]